MPIQKSAVLKVHQWGYLLGCGFGLAIMATGCTGTFNAQSLEKNLAADPQLTNTPGGLDNPATQLPADFPSEIPRYPGATLVVVEPLPGQSGQQGVRTQWQSSEPSDRLVRFFQDAFSANNWSIETRPSDDRQGSFVAKQNNITVTVAISALPSPAVNATPSPPVSQFTLEYQRSGSAVSAGSNPDGMQISNSGAGTSIFPDLSQAPQPLQAHITSLAQLGVLAPLNQRFQPNAAITRREFIRWMVTAHNKIFTNRPALQIRLTTTSASPLFKDVPKTDTDFSIIQGAAEAGLVPSALSGDSTALLFRPDAPLTRETLLLWKVPLDARRSLPTASVDSIKEVWGFQDAARITPKALKAVLADHQNGDLSNISRVFGYTTLFQPQRSVTRAEAAASLWYFGFQGDGFSADDALQAQVTPNLQGSNTPSVTLPPATPTPAATAATPTPVATSGSRP